MSPPTSPAEKSGRTESDSEFYKWSQDALAIRIGRSTSQPILFSYAFEECLFRTIWSFVDFCNLLNGETYTTSMWVAKSERRRLKSVGPIEVIRKVAALSVLTQQIAKADGEEVAFPTSSIRTVRGRSDSIPGPSIRNSGEAEDIAASFLEFATWCARRYMFELMGDDLFRVLVAMLDISWAARISATEDKERQS